MKVETKIYFAPECQVLQMDITTPVLVGSDLTTTEDITIDEEVVKW